MKIEEFTILFSDLTLAVRSSGDTTIGTSDRGVLVQQPHTWEFYSPSISSLFQIKKYRAALDLGKKYIRKHRKLVEGTAAQEDPNYVFPGLANMYEGIV